MSTENLNEDQKMILDALKETKEIQTVADELRTTHRNIDSVPIFKELMKLKRARLEK